jgi:hypothetical protein
MISRVAPLVHVDTGLLAGEGGEAAAETTDGSQGEGNLRTPLEKTKGRRLVERARGRKHE